MLARLQLAAVTRGVALVVLLEAAPAPAAAAAMTRCERPSYYCWLRDSLH